MQRISLGLSATLALTLALPIACDKKDAGTGSAKPDAAAEPSAKVVAGQKTFETKCIACHTIGQGDRTGPDLRGVTKRRSPEWLKKWLKDPVAMGASDHIGKAVSAKYGDIIMPDPGLSDAQIGEMLAFLEHASASSSGYQPPKEPPRELAGAEMDKAKEIYFDRCAGCHGASREGAMGPKLDPERMRALGSVLLRATVSHGSAGGMPAWGDLGILSTTEVDLVSNYLQMTAPDAPQFGAAEIAKHHILKTEVASRPKQPAHKRNWKNFFAVVMRDQGEVAIIDGDAREKLTLIQAGFSVDTVRASASGRYLYALGRDGRITLIDLWTDPPSVAAQARGCFDTRSLEASRAKGYADKYLVEGCYWPPQYVVFDGSTLEVKHVGSVLPEGETKLKQVRVGSIVAPQSSPVWAMTFMEPGTVGIVDYTKPEFPLVASVTAQAGIFNGGLDHTGRYFIAAAGAKDELSVVDLKEKKSAGTVATGKRPYPGRGANWEDPEAGWVNATPHIGEGKLLVYGADPEKAPDKAWKKVREVGGIAAGGLNVRTHPKSPWVWVDSPANRNPKLARQICVIAKKNGKVEKCWQPRSSGRVLDFAYNAEGTEVWVSGWDKKGSIHIYDDATLKEAQRIEADWVVTPSAKFNVANSAENVH